MRKLSITRALSELKVLKKRHENELCNLKPIAVRHGNKLMRPYVSIKVEDFEKQIEPGNQSIEKLEQMIFEIKSKINESNSKTIVKIGENEMTVQEAIVKKELIELKKNRLNVLKRHLLQARNSFEEAVDDNKMKVEKQVQDVMQNSASKKIDSDMEKSINDSIEMLYKVEFVDKDLATKIQQLESEIEDFENNVDFALSESNSTTYIELDD